MKTYITLTIDGTRTVRADSPEDCIVKLEDMGYSCVMSEIIGETDAVKAL